MSNFSIQKFIADRRDGNLNSQEDISQFCQEIAKGSIPDYQISAWLMAAYLKPLSLEETTDLTIAMAESGSQLNLTGLPKPWVDKHSTGGVGDKTSLVILPLLASMGLTMVKMSGRGLGITGGTVDKLQSVAGFRMDLSADELLAQAKKIGIAITGQSQSLAPADKVLYALRDTTETIASIPLIVSSILSKKFASGADIIVIDVKCGSGAFMKTLTQAKELKHWLEKIGEQAGRIVACHISDMDQPLGEAVGNAIEVQEAISVLKNQDGSASRARFKQLVLSLASATAVTARIAQSYEKGMELAIHHLESGLAELKAQEWFRAQGAADLAVAIEPLPSAGLKAKQSGWIQHIDAERIGQAVLELGGGRKAKDDTIDPQVGILLSKPIGHQIAKDEALLTVKARTLKQAQDVAHSLELAVLVSPTPIPVPALLIS